MIRIDNGYAPRPIRPIGTWETSGVTFKVYGITADGDAPCPPLVDAAHRAAAEIAAKRAPGWRHHGVGFVGVHEGATGNLVFVDLWSDDNELRHVVLTSPRDAPTDLREDDLLGCVWDLAVIDFERRAWIEHVLTKPNAPDRDGYLAQRMDSVV